MSSITKKMTHAEIIALKQRYIDAERRKTPPYAIYQLKLSDCVITAYESGKVVFQGEGAAYHAQGYTIKQPTTDLLNVDTNIGYPQCGSDEVGTGDYFGPVVVCATYVSNEDITYLKQLNIQDSKAVQDEQIRVLGPQLIKHLPHSLLIMNNAKYNQIHETDNMVAIKCKLHNQAFVHLRQKLPHWPSCVIIDQFVKGSSYYRYLQHEKEVIHDIHFETKAENKYLAVACGSIIARYAFLLSFDAMEERYGFTFLKGAGAKVDENIAAFIKQFGKTELFNVAKLHFANTKKAFNILDHL